MTARHTPGLAVKRVTMKDAIAHIHRDGQEAYGYMVADCIMAERADLLAALEDVLQHCVTVRGMPDKDKGRTQAQQSALDQSRAAISRAKGAMIGEAGATALREASQDY